MKCLSTSGRALACTTRRHRWTDNSSSSSLGRAAVCQNPTRRTRRLSRLLCHVYSTRLALHAGAQSNATFGNATFGENPSLYLQPLHHLKRCSPALPVGHFSLLAGIVPSTLAPTRFCRMAFNTADLYIVMNEGNIYFAAPTLCIFSDMRCKTMLEVPQGARLANLNRGTSPGCWSGNAMPGHCSCLQAAELSATDLAACKTVGVRVCTPSDGRPAPVRTRDRGQRACVLRQQVAAAPTACTHGHSWARRALDSSELPGSPSSDCSQASSHASGRPATLDAQGSPAAGCLLGFNGMPARLLVDEWQQARGASGCLCSSAGCVPAYVPAQCPG